MPIRWEPHITRAMLRAEPDTLWVFGDSLARRGLGGQAAEMRGEPNAVGIPTKCRPARDPSAYFTDDDLPAFREAAAPAFARLAAHLRARGIVVWPTAGIGTGLADLEQRAPRIWASLERARLRLEEIAAHREAIEVEALRLWRHDAPDAAADWRQGTPLALVIGRDVPWPEGWGPDAEKRPEPEPGAL